jgi:hypothetical protein
MTTSIYSTSINTSSSSVCLQHTVNRGVLKINDQGNLDPNRSFFSSISAGTGVTEIVAGVEGQNILVTNYVLSSQSGTSIRFLSGTGYISGNIYIGTNDETSGNGPVLKTSSGESLSISNSSGTVGGRITYKIV